MGVFLERWPPAGFTPRSQLLVQTGDANRTQHPAAVGDDQLVGRLAMV
jgi:hypothetical protein